MSTTTTTQTTNTVSHSQVQLAAAPVAVGHNFQDLARGDRAGRLKLKGIPTFSDPVAQRQWMKEHMAAAFRFFAKHGYAEGIAGHISMRGEKTRSMAGNKQSTTHSNHVFPAKTQFYQTTFG